MFQRLTTILINKCSLMHQVIYIPIRQWFSILDGLNIKLEKLFKNEKKNFCTCTTKFVCSILRC